MTHAPTTPQEDLAFLRGITESGPGQWAAGQIFFVAGLIYGAQCLGHWAQAQGWLDLTMSQTLTLAIAPSVVFFIYVAAVSLRPRAAAATPVGATGRAMSSAFFAAGMANIVMMGVFGFSAWRRHDVLIWELYPAVVFAMQGAAWLLAYLMRRRGWQLLVGLGWLVAAVALGLLIDTPAYVLAAAVSILLLMALPGWVMMRLARQAG